MSFFSENFSKNVFCFYRSLQKNLGAVRDSVLVPASVISRTTIYTGRENQDLCTFFWRPSSKSNFKLSHCTKSGSVVPSISKYVDLG